MTTSLRREFDHQLWELQQDVLHMGAYVVDMLDLAMQALLQQDLKLVDQVVGLDDAADQMDLEIEHTCMRLLAQQQPMSRDLRIIGTALKIITDLERIGDFSVDIAKTARRMSREAYVQPPARLAELGDCVKALVGEALRSYVNRDLAQVRRAVAMDDAVDHLYDEIFTELMTSVARDPAIYRQATWFTHIIHFLERIADHAVNVAERVYYMETGEFEQLARSHRSDAESLG